MGSPARQALLWILLSLPAGAAYSVETTPTEHLARAEQAFAQRRYHDVLGDLQHVPETHELAPRAQFLRAYAHYQLGALDRAEGLLAGLEDSPEIGLLRGMVAYGRGAFDKALTRLKRVTDTGQQPWSATAEKLTQRVRADADRARDHRFAALIKQVEKDLKTLHFSAARRTLAEAERLKPRQLMASYYRGYMAYKQMRYKRAARHLRQALAIDANDGWSRYMLALTQSESGDLPAARTALTQLRSGAKDPQLRHRAREALELLDSPGEQRRSGLTVFGELGSGLDTYPAYFFEDSTVPYEASWELHAVARASYQHWFARAIKGIAGASVFERAYAKGGERYEQTEVDGWGTLSLVRERFNAALSYSYALFLYGHSPVSSAHGGHLSFNYALRSWLWLVTAGRVVGRPIHDVDYDYLPWLDVGATAGARLIRGRLTVELSYDLARAWAVRVGGTPKSGKSGRKPQEPEPIRDYTNIGHGPYLWARVRLPWRMQIFGGIGLIHRPFDTPSSQGTTVYGPREDLTLSSQLELTRRFPAGFELALRFESVDNFSNLEEDVDGSNRNYTRRLAGAAVRWTWPPK